MAGRMPRPIPPGVVEIDDSRLRDMWTRHQQRSLFTARALRMIGIVAVLGIAAVLAAIALAFWALERKPPVVKVAPAEVHVTIPEQKAPVVNVYPNITIPPQPAPAVSPGLPQFPQPLPGPENKVVTEYTIFREVHVDGFRIETGWKYHYSNDTVPYIQFCQWYPNQNEVILLGRDGVINGDLALQASKLGAGVANAERYFNYCVWFGR